MTESRVTGLVLTHDGLEQVSAQEIAGLISVQEIKAEKGKVFFSCGSVQDLIDLCYHGRTFTKVVQLLTDFSFVGMPQPKMTDIPYIQPKIIVLCERKGTHDFTSADVEKVWSQAIAEKYSVQMEYKRPDTTYFLLIEDNHVWFGVDFSGVDLGRRDYRIFLGAEALKGNIAAGLLFFAGYDSKMSLCDPFCRQGIIPIEAALLATDLSPHKYDKEKFTFTKLPNIKFELKDKEKDFKGTIISMDDNFKNVSSSQKNAKIAGVVKSINFSRTDLQWLDAKFGKNFLDMIITYPPQLSKVIADKVIEKVYHQLFYQSEFIMKKGGKVCVVMKRGIDILKKKAEEFKFKVEKEMHVKQGAEELVIILFRRDQ